MSHEYDYSSNVSSYEVTIVLICVCSDFCPGYTGLLTNDVYYTFCSLSLLTTEYPSWQLLRERSMWACQGYGL